jgi:hypothetical protein
MVDGMPKYVSVLGQTDTLGGWRDNKATDGCILEVPSGRMEKSKFGHYQLVQNNVNLSLPRKLTIYATRYYVAL